MVPLVCVLELTGLGHTSMIDVIIQADSKNSDVHASGDKKLKMHGLIDVMPYYSTV